MSLLEVQRQLLEENDALEVAVAQRFRKNPGLAGSCRVDQSHKLATKKKRSHKETLLEEHELKFFEETSKSNSKRLKEQLSSKSDLVKEIKAFKDPDFRFHLFLDAMKDLDSKRGDKQTSAKTVLSSILPYLSAPEEDRKPETNKVKRKHLLSVMGAHIRPQLGLKFNEVEQFGKFVDLSFFFDQYKLLVPSKVTYVEYLRKFADFPYLTTSDEYKRYLHQLLEYLLEFYQKTHPLDDVEKLLENEEDSGEEQVEEGKPNDKGEVFCKACDKLFTKESVYKGHLDGKKHKKNQKALEENSEPVKKATNATTEKQIAQLAKLLKPTIEETINHIERRAAASERERMIEDTALAEEEEEFTATDTDSSDESDSDDDDDLLSKHLPLGTDGTPIPLWLYKLQGLHKSYNCEICGNTKYKGRQQFDKHFHLAKHIHGLQCLGVDDEALVSFVGISSIDEANELWQKLKKIRRSEEKAAETAVEVEDEEGNVMPEKDYLELKKQGLL